MNDQPVGSKVCPFCGEHFFSTAFVVHLDLEFDLQNLMNKADAK